MSGARRPQFAARAAERAARQRRRRWLLVGAVVAVIGVFVAGAWVVMRTSVFGVARVSVAGAHRLTSAAVIAAARVPQGHPLATLDVGAISARVAALPPVAHVSVQRDFPHSVRIDVRERVPVAAVSLTHGVGLIDRTGVMFATVDTPPAGLPVVVLAHPGPSDPVTRAVLDVVAALPRSLRTRVQTVSASGPASVQLALRGGATVVWGDASQSARKAQVLLALLKQHAHVYDVSTPGIVTTR